MDVEMKNVSLKAIPHMPIDFGIAISFSGLSYAASVAMIDELL